MRGRIVFLVVVLSALLLAACGGGGGGGGPILPPPTGGGGGGGGSLYPQHYTSDLDGIWWCNASNVDIDDPHNIWDFTPAELEADIEEDPIEIQNGRQVVGTLPFDMQITVNRVSKLSNTQYEVVVQGTITQVVDGNTVTMVLDTADQGFLNAARTTWTGSGTWTFWAYDDEGTKLYIGTISYGFSATKGSAPGS